MTDAVLRPLAARQAAPDAERWLEALPAPVLGIDGGERIRFVNAAAAELLAGVGRGLLGRRLDEIFGPDAPIIDLARRALSGASGVAETDVALVGPGFALGRATVAAGPVGDNGYIALVLTRPPRARTAPPVAGHSAARTLAHEVRNPLAGIRAAAQLIARTDDPDSAALAKLICDEVDRIRRLTDKIDPMAAFEPPRFELFNIHEALERVRKLVGSSAPDVMIREHYDPSLPQVRGDFDQLIQAFLNIAKNAAEAVAGQADGEIAIVTSYRPGVKFRSAASGAARAQLEVQIVDNGPGLHPDVVDRLFEAFATTKANGMGLGLTVAADIVARHDGRIEVDSNPGRTAFKILLPIDPEDSP
ncbi:MAG TPA: ATP-binding protein [Vitreimonas sp.]|uniref:two-component system sensor histidine kinase NtrB n=1 Tax=Vitreimonas sp. TaxID=3069702 RepID=UPI002D42A6CD|nr:ATP-binding protein [Vitreimonas sp.]HYD87463.1 ATP-binding protein [Vitreimonas sp.]